MSTFRGSRIPVNPRKPTQFPRLHTLHERIPIFMIHEKDASAPCDERHVKYRRNTNLLTQRKTGGKRIMGNQGTKNWKLTAFFAISLMLIAGLFSNAAIADGEGTITVEWATEADDNLDATFPADGSRTVRRLFHPDEVVDADALVPLPAGSTENQLRFLYRVNTNMAGGQVRIQLPGDAWKIIRIIDAVADPNNYDAYSSVNLVEVIEKTGDDDEDIVTIYRLNRDGKAADGSQVDLATSTEEDVDDLKALAGRVTAEDTQITVDLGNEWRSGGELMVILRNVTTGIPSSLSPDMNDGDPPYHSYEFTTYSKKSGILRRLRPVRIDHDGDEADADDKGDFLDATVCQGW